MKFLFWDASYSFYAQKIVGSFRLEKDLWDHWVRLWWCSPTKAGTCCAWAGHQHYRAASPAPSTCPELWSPVHTPSHHKPLLLSHPYSMWQDCSVLVLSWWTWNLSRLGMLRSILISQSTFCSQECPWWVMIAHAEVSRVVSLAYLDMRNCAVHSWGAVKRNWSLWPFAELLQQ